MDCARSQELLSDHLEGALHDILRVELEAHLTECEDCRSLREGVAEVVEALRAYPSIEPPLGLVDRIVLASRGLRSRQVKPYLVARAPIIRPAVVIPSWMQAAAAGFAMVAIGVLLMIVGPESSTRAASRLVERTVSAGNEILERKDRMVEDVRILGVVLTTAFEGRLERVNERVEDYRRLLERRTTDGKVDSKRGRGPSAFAARVAEHAGFRTGDEAGT